MPAKAIEEPSRLTFRAFANADKKQNKMLRDLIGGAPYSVLNPTPKMQIDRPGIVPRDVTVEQLAKSNMDFRIARASVENFQRGVLQELAGRGVGGPAQSGLVGPNFRDRPGLVGNMINPIFPGLDQPLPASAFARDVVPERIQEGPERNRLSREAMAVARIQALENLGSILPQRRDNGGPNPYIRRTPAEAAEVQAQVDAQVIGEPSAIGTMLGTAQVQLARYPIVESPSIKFGLPTQAGQLLANAEMEGSINPDGDVAADMLNSSGALLMPDYPSTDRVPMVAGDYADNDYIQMTLPQAHQVINAAQRVMRISNRVANVERLMAKQGLSEQATPEQQRRFVSIMERYDQPAVHAELRLMQRPERARRADTFRRMMATSDGKPGAVLDSDT